MFDRPLRSFGPTIRAVLPLLALGLALATPPVHGFERSAEPNGTVSAEPNGSVVERAIQAFRNEQSGSEAEIIRLLRSPDHAEPVLDALMAFERLPTGIWRAVSTSTTDEYPSATRLAAIRVLPRFGTREAATRLIALLSDPGPGLADAARHALRDMTGRGDDWDDDRWRAWGSEIEGWSDRAWASAMTTRLAARHRDLSVRHRALGEEVVGLYRRLHVELDAAGRTTLLAELIRDERPPLRDLGFELAGRDLSARTQLGPEVAAAAAARLAHPDGATRAKAATLVSRLVPPDAMLTLTRALKNERDPIAAEPMLLGVARWPNEEAVLPTIRWLEREDAPYGATTTALWALAQADLLNEQALRDRITTTLRERGLGRGGEPALKLLVRLGTDADLDRVAELLEATDDPQRNTAANALAETRRGSALLIEAAAQDPRLFPPATRAINTHHASPEGLSMLAGLPVIDPATREAAILDLAARIRPEDLARAVIAAGLPITLSEQALARLADPELQRTPGVIEGLLLLAEKRVQLRRNESARDLLATLDATMLGESQVRRWNRLRLTAAVGAGDLEQARALNAPSLDDWLTAWRNLPENSELRQPVAELIAERHAREMTREVREELGLTNAADNANPDD